VELRSGRHAGRTDLPLTDTGRQEASLLGAHPRGHRFQRVLTSPLARTAETCRLAGFGGLAEVREKLLEWDYGSYEGAPPKKPGPSAPVVSAAGSFRSRWGRPRSCIHCAT
jgi:broad specificity phosphatase PhoE